MQVGEDQGCREAIRPTMVFEAEAYLAEELNVSGRLLPAGVVKDVEQSLANTGGVVATDQVGEMEQGFDQILAAPGEALGKIFALAGWRGLESGDIFPGPGLERGHERLGLLLGRGEVEALDVGLLRMVQRLEEDGNGAVGERFGERAEGGEGLRGEDGAIE